MGRSLPAQLVIAREHNWVAWYPEGECFVNLAGSYDYLELAYYISQERELKNECIHPTGKEMLDAYVPPLFLERARLAGLSTPNYYLSNGYFEPPVVIDPINPFMIKSRLVLKPGREKAVAKSMTRNFTYAICCQELPAGAKVVYFRMVLGWSTSVRFRTISQELWESFGIPLAKVRVVVTAENENLVSDISPLPFHSLRSRELQYLEQRIQWDR